MIIMNNWNGLGNRLFYFAYCMALAERSGHAVMSHEFPEWQDQFHTGHGAICVWPRSTRPHVRWPEWTRRLFAAVLKKLVSFEVRFGLPGVRTVWCRKGESHLTAVDNPDFIARLRATPVVIMGGFPELNHVTLPNGAAIREFFAPKPEIAAACWEITRRARGSADLLVAMHLRWGDYRDFQNGSFYYPPESYRQVMERCAELAEGRTVAFLVVTNEPDKLAPGCFGDLTWTLGSNTLLEDLYSMALCDYVVCPASSFSLWAAFYGAKPVWCMNHADARPGNLADFVVTASTVANLHPAGSMPS